MAKIAELTIRYISENPEIKSCLAKDLVNYSKLARQIAENIKTKKIDAIIVACRRYAEKIRKKSADYESGLDILKKSRKTIKIENKLAYLTFTAGEKDLTKIINSLKQ